MIETIPSYSPSLTVRTVAGIMALRNIDRPQQDLITLHLPEDAGVAQLVEQRFRKPQVGGSIPLAGSMLSA